MRTLKLRYGAVVCLFANLVASGYAQPKGMPTTSADAATLAEYHVAATPESLATFLSQYANALGEIEKARALVAQLGDLKYRVRETATRSLSEGEHIPTTTLQRALRSSDPEVAARAERILAHPQVARKVIAAEARTSVFAAVCRTIAAQAVLGSAPKLFDILPLLESPELIDLATESLAASVAAGDASLLQQKLSSPNSAVKCAAIRGSGRSNTLANPQLSKLSEDRDPRVALAAAHTLAERGDRSALPVLIRLLAAEEPSVRARSEQILRAWTGRDFGFNPFLDATSQQVFRERWQTWLASEGKTEKLAARIDLKPLPEDLQHGLALHYAFDKTDDGRLTDASKHRRHGTVYNTHALVDGVSGKALELRGQGDTGDTGGHASLPFIDFTTIKQFTIALWVKEAGLSDDHGEAYITFGADRGVGLEDSLGISHFNSNLVFRVGGALVVTEYDRNDKGRWVHYALTFADGELRGYKNGRLLGTARGTVAVVGKQAALGRHWWHHGEVSSTRFVGAMDDLRIYERALTSIQLEQLAQKDK